MSLLRFDCLVCDQEMLLADHLDDFGIEFRASTCFCVRLLPNHSDGGRRGLAVSVVAQGPCRGADARSTPLTYRPVMALRCDVPREPVAARGDPRQRCGARHAAATALMYLPVMELGVNASRRKAEMLVVDAASSRWR